MATPQKVLTINFGGIGDEILFIPALKKIRALLPAAKITLLLEPRSKSVDQVTDLIDDTITFDIKKKPLTPADLLTLLKLIKAGSYDVVISSGASPQVSILLYLAGIPVRIGYGANALARFLLTHPVTLLREQYAADMYEDLVFGLSNYLQNKKEQPAIPKAQSQIPQIIVKDESLKRMQDELDANSFYAHTYDTARGACKIVLLHPGTSAMAVSKGIIKHWPSQNWLALIERLAQINNTESQVKSQTGDQAERLPFGLRIILAGGPDDKQVIADLEAELNRAPGGRPANFESFAGKTKGLSDLAALMQASELIVCVDSAPMHLAVGLNKKTVALFGPTDPAKLIPINPRFAVLADRSEPRSLQDGLGVRLPPDTVYQSSLDLLKAE